ncbi:TetR family transcriptional regulator [Halothiobacillus diazotrophicus]|uniref:TetR family transcriptional regulator n=1 Tax=Halothiobacillus diazotrophicus TaxID=1860122 RepID=A0A191ZHJ7_9GAMM|nr:TetR/AcrR family transcriptional regulator [Halothiobacillus diazotrophicus]ANJ67327.1 TetR family transcriptional regulator [Halothiobacillus diazotrophicus]
MSKLSADKPTLTQPSARMRILLAAHDLFYRDGIRATGVDRVIAESGVTKVTFYRHFPSKNDLIREFLAFRHQRWMTWFTEALQRHGGDDRALVPALAEWFGSENYRGCAFINSVGELGTTLPDVVTISHRHKQDMADVIAGLLPENPQRAQHARALALAVDGAIVRAQMDASPEEALRTLDWIVHLLPISGNGTDSE